MISVLFISFISLYDLLRIAEMSYSSYTISLLQELHNSDQSLAILNHSSKSTLKYFWLWFLTFPVKISLNNS